MNRPEMDLDSLSLVCPMLECGEDLYLTWSLAYGLTVGDVNHGGATGNVILPADAETSNWTVECVARHVILVPSSAACCDGEDCRCDSDSSDEYRTFRTADVVRLREMIELIAQAQEPRPASVSADQSEPGTAPKATGGDSRD